MNPFGNNPEKQQQHGRAQCDSRERLLWEERSPVWKAPRGIARNNLA
jgi:hypothetical protein